MQFVLKKPKNKYIVYALLDKGFAIQVFNKNSHGVDKVFISWKETFLMRFSVLLQNYIEYSF
jgi:hypothetical protein